jgi:hypothetical protein
MEWQESDQEDCRLVYDGAGIIKKRERKKICGDKDSRENGTSHKFMAYR